MTSHIALDDAERSGSKDHMFAVETVELFDKNFCDLWRKRRLGEFFGTNGNIWLEEPNVIATVLCYFLLILS